MCSSFLQNKKLGKGINLANALEAPNEGDWGVVIKDEYFQFISDAGFSSVRIPIKWSAHSSKISPFDIKESFFQRIDSLIQKAFDVNLKVIINVHHFDELYKRPNKFSSQFLSLWKQISERYKNYPDSLFFELLNEPRYILTTSRWNLLLNEAINIIRNSNPARTLLVGPARWNNIVGLKNLSVPQNKENIIVTFHYYKPFRFTHQAAHWVPFSKLFLGTTWLNSISQQNTIERHFKFVHEWGRKNNVPINLGEFGAYDRADLNSRALWTNHVAKTAEKYGFSWTYWEFGAGFGAYDTNIGKWNSALLNSLIPKAQTE